MTKKKSLKSRAIKIQGKDYVLVSDRVIYFNEQYPKGCIQTKLLKWDKEGNIVIKAYIYPEGKDGRYFTGYSQEKIGTSFINKTSALENAETSAVGRALAMMGIGVIDSIASVDELNKAKNRSKKPNRFVDKVEYEYKSGVKNGKFYEGWVPVNDKDAPVFWGDMKKSAGAKIGIAISNEKAKKEGKGERTPF